MLENLHNVAEKMIRHAGDRVTNKRVYVLSILLAEQKALTHREIEGRINRTQRFDRVTLYRILEWLSNKNLTHKIACGDRVWRFRVNTISHSQHHAHFKCTRCAKVVCLSDLVLDFQSLLPLGYQYQQAELTVKGVCAECI